MARPLKQPDDRASGFFHVRVTPAERAQLDAKATAARVRKSDFARAALLGYRLPPAPVTQAAVRELQAIGNNLNQLAHHANTTGTVQDQAALQRSLEQLQAALAQVLDAALAGRHGRHGEASAAARMNP